MTFIRDRTNLFISYRQSYTHQPLHDFAAKGATNEPLMSGETEAIEMESMPPQWLDLTAQLDRALDQIRKEMAQLQPLHKKYALPGFDDRTSSDKEIETLTVAITRALHKCQALVKTFGQIAKQQTEPALYKMAENIQVAMAAKLQECSTQFRQMQSAYLKSLQQDELGDLPGMMSNSRSSASDFLLDTSNSVGQQQLMQNDVALSQLALERGSQLAYEDEEVRLREQGINRVADTILEVAEIFRDLQTMVIDQGALVDRIDYNIENTLTSVKGADRELVQGERYQKRTQKCKVIFLMVLIAIALVIILIFKPHGHRYAQASAPPVQPPAPPAPQAPQTDSNSAGAADGR